MNLVHESVHKRTYETFGCTDIQMDFGFFHGKTTAECKENIEIYRLDIQNDIMGYHLIGLVNVIYMIFLMGVILYLVICK